MTDFFKSFKNGLLHQQTSNILNLYFSKKKKNFYPLSYLFINHIKSGGIKFKKIFFRIVYYKYVWDAMKVHRATRIQYFLLSQHFSLFFLFIRTYVICFPAMLTQRTEQLSSVELEMERSIRF